MVCGTVLGAAEEDVAGGEAVRGGHKLAVGSMEGEGDISLGATGHERGAGGGVVAKANDAIEIMERNTELGLPLMSDFDCFPILAEIGVFEGYEKGVEMGFHQAGKDSSWQENQAWADCFVRGWQTGRSEQEAHFLGS